MIKFLVQLNFGVIIVRVFHKGVVKRFKQEDLQIK